MMVVVRVNWFVELLLVLQRIQAMTFAKGVLLTFLPKFFSEGILS